MTFKKYLLDSILKSSAHVTFVGNDERGEYICLSETCFHPQGGGQPSDRGYINTSRVLKVVKVGDQVYHYVPDSGALQVGNPVHLVVDYEWRLICSKLHSAGHLISALVEDRYAGTKSTGGHHWPGEARVEFEGLPTNTVVDVAGINLDLDNTVEFDLPVEVCFDQTGARSIQIGSFPQVGCGGTHVRTTGELNGVRVLKAKRKGEILRISYDIRTEPEIDASSALPDEAKYLFMDGTANYLNWNNQCS